MKSSKLAAAVVALLLFGSLFAGSVAAVESSPQELPEESEVGTEFEATFEVTDLFDEFERWTLVANTGLDNATWTIRQYNQAGSQITREDTDGSTASEAVDIDDGTATVEVRVTGTTPELGELSYEPPDRFLAANVTLERDGGTERVIGEHESHHYTQESREARQAIDSASDAVGDSDGDARSSLDSAISAYESGNFENAISLAERAEGEATQSQTIRTALLGVGVVIVLAILLGGGYWVYKSRQQGPSRLK